MEETEVLEPFNWANNSNLLNFFLSWLSLPFVFDIKLEESFFYKFKDINYCISWTIRRSKEGQIVGYSRIIQNSWNRFQNTESYSGLNQLNLLKKWTTSQLPPISRKNLFNDLLN